MALVISEPTAEATSSTDGTSFAPLSAYTPTANAFQIVFVFAAGTTAAGSMTGGSLTWTQAITPVTSGAGSTLYVFTAQAGGSPASCDPTFDCTGDLCTGVVMSVLEVTGHSTSSPIRQVGTGMANAANPVATFSGALLTSNAYVFGAGLNRTAPACAPPASFTETCDTGHTTPNSGMALCYRVNGETGTTLTMTAATGNYAAAALEINDVSNGDTTVSPTGVASTTALGSPTITTGSVTVLPTGIASTVAFGSPTVSSGSITERVRYVNTASSAGGDGTTNATSGANRAYATLQAALTAEAADLVAASVFLTIYCEGSAADTSEPFISGFTTSATSYINIVVTQANRHDGKWNTGKYRVVNSGYYGAIHCEGNNVRITGLQIENQKTSAGVGTEAAGISLFGNANNCNYIIDSCVIRYTGDYTNQLAWGVSTSYLFDFTGHTLSIVNNVIYDFKRGLHLRVSPGSTYAAYGNTIHGSTENGIDYNISASGCTLRLYNNLVQSSITKDYENNAGSGGTLVSATNISEDATSPDTSFRSKVAIFVNEAGDDFHLGASDTVAKDLGTTLSADSFYPVTKDIDGTTRTGSWDIGADESDSGALLPTGIASTLVFGSPTITTGSVTVLPTGIASTVAFGSPTLTTGAVTILATGIASTLVFGSPTLTTGSVTVFPTGLASTLVFGSPTITTGSVTVLPTGIASTLAFGSPTISAGAVNILATGIASTLAFGSPTLTGGEVTVLPTGIASTLVFGSPTITTGEVTILATGIASTLVFGSPTLSQTAAQQDLLPTGIASTLAFGSLTITTGEVTILATGIASTLAFGSPTLTTGAVTILATGIASTLAFGSPTITTGVMPILPDGIASTLVFGSPTLSTGTVTLFPNGIASTLAFGSLTFIQTGINQTLLPTGIASTLAFGLPSFGQHLGLYPRGIASTLRFGRPEMIYIPKPDVPPIAVDEVEFTDSLFQLSIKEIYRGEDYFDLLQKVANHVVVETAMLGSIQITREGFIEDGIGLYAIKETGSGLMIGLFKSVAGVLKPISPGLPGEIRILQGQAGVEMVPPAGWKFVDDVAVKERYNIGNSPNFRVAVIRYVGI